MRTEQPTKCFVPLQGEAVLDELGNLYSVILRKLVPLHYSLAYVPFNLMVNCLRVL